jgi:hypothetical protein
MEQANQPAVETQSQGQATAQPTNPLSKLFARLSGANQAPATQQAPAASPSNQQAPMESPSMLPEDFFGKLFAPQEPTKQATETKPNNPWEVNQEVLQANFGNLDVNNFIKPEALDAAMRGDKAAFMSIINTAVSMGAMSSYQAAMNNSKQGVELSAKEMQQQLPDYFKKMSLENNLGQDPVLSAPHLQPVVKMVRDAILSKHPKATDADVKEGVMLYFQSIGGEFSPSKQSAKPAQSTNWDDHFAQL